MHDADDRAAEQPTDIDELAAFKAELFRVVKSSGIPQYSKSKDGLNTKLHVSRSTLSNALGTSGTDRNTVPSAALVRGIAEYCDNGDEFLVRYGAWVRRWQITTELQRQQLPPRPQRAEPDSGGRATAAPEGAALDSPLTSTPDATSSHPDWPPKSPDEQARSASDSSQDEPPTDGQRRSRTSAFVAGAVVLAVAIAATVWMATRRSPAEQEESRTEPSTSAPQPTDRSSLAAAGTPVTGDGPWPFEVADTGGLGLFIRSGPEEDDPRLSGQPVAQDGSTLWADCEVFNSFDADPSTGAGGHWYRIHWPEPSSEQLAYGYAGFMRPVGHDGNLPDCEPTSP